MAIGDLRNPYQADEVPGSEMTLEDYARQIRANRGTNPGSVFNTQGREATLAAKQAATQRELSNIAGITKAGKAIIGAVGGGAAGAGMGAGAGAGAAGGAGSGAGSGFLQSLKGGFTGAGGGGSRLGGASGGLLRALLMGR